MTQPFHFSNGQQAYSAEDLLELCKKFPDDGSNYLVREDLEKWLIYIGKEDIARCATDARQTTADDRQKLEDFLTRCHALSSPETKTVTEEVSQPNSPVETKPEPTPVATETTPAENVAQTPAPVPTSPATPQSNTPSAKPSFFRTIARLVVNVLYRNKN